MPTINLSLPVAGTVVGSGLHAANYSALQTLLNGGLDATNLAEGAVTGPKLAAGYNNKVTQSNIGSPPSSPSTGDIWIATGVGGEAIQWQFVYRPEYSGPYDWFFIGGPALVTFPTAMSLPTTGYNHSSVNNIVLPRDGIYDVKAFARMGNLSGVTCTFYVAPALNSVNFAQHMGHSAVGNGGDVAVGSEARMTGGAASYFNVAVYNSVGHASSQATEMRVSATPVAVS